MNALVSLFIWAIGYLSGSLCSAVVVSRLFDLPDPRTQGSKNPGATNVLRLAGKQYALIVLLVDMLKGLVPVLLAELFGCSLTVIGFTAFFAVIGHMYPLFFKFKGGKGVATAVGALLGLHFMLGVVVIATWLLVAKFMRYSSLASLVALALAPLYAIGMVQSFDVFPSLFFITMFVFYQHRDNITRLMDGDEPKFILKSPVLNEGPVDELVPVQKAKAKAKPKAVVKAKVKAAAKPKPKKKAVK